MEADKDNLQVVLDAFEGPKQPTNEAAGDDMDPGAVEEAFWAWRLGLLGRGEYRQMLMKAVGVGDLGQRTEELTLNPEDFAALASADGQGRARAKAIYEAEGEARRGQEAIARAIPCKTCGRRRDEHSVPYEYTTLGRDCQGGFRP